VIAFVRRGASVSVTLVRGAARENYDVDGQRLGVVDLARNRLAGRRPRQCRVTCVGR
jgi:hypothetical protein